MRGHSIGCAATWVAAVFGASCSSSDPTISTNSTWVDPIMEPVLIQWTEPADCLGESRGCEVDVPFTLEQIHCDGCLLGIGRSFMPVENPSGTLYQEGLTLFGIPQTVGPLTITAVVRRTNGETRTISATAMGDRVSGLRSECWTVPTDAFPPNGAACGATRTPGNDVYIVVIGETTNNGEFAVEHDGVDGWFEHPGANAREGIYFSLPDATPTSSVWSELFVSATLTSAVKLTPDTTTSSVSFHWQLVVGDAVATTAVIPPLAP